MNDFEKITLRKDLPKYTKYKPKSDDSRWKNTKNEKDYDFYKCDYCGAEIKILEKRFDMTGGTIELPNTITKMGDLKLALCNKCLKPVLKIFEFEEVKNK